MSRVCINDDYAILEAGKYSFYYGYEETDESGDNWCFVVTENDGDELLRVPSPQLGPMYLDPDEMLLRGIGLFLEGNDAVI